MKKFTKLLICFVLCVCALGLVACDKRSDKEKNFVYPTAADEVYGNGGLAVKKGNYLYFVNGFTATADMQNKKDSYTVGALMLVKLGNNGQVVRDENGFLVDDYCITMNSKLCGFEATGLFVAGDYLYFTSPCLENEGGKNAKDEVWAKERVTFNRIKLNKTGSVEKLHQTQVTNENVEFKYYEHNGEVSILVFEKGADADNENKKDRLFKVTANGVTCIDSDIDENVVMGEKVDEIFYSKQVENDDVVTYKIVKYNIATGVASDYKTFNSAVTLKFVADSYVYYTVTRGEYTNLERTKVNDALTHDEVYYNVSRFEDLRITPNGEAIVAVKEHTFHFIDPAKKNTSIGEFNSIVDEDASSINIIGFANGCIVYYSGTEVKSISYANYVENQQKDINKLANMENLNTNYFDLDDNYLYCFNKVGEHEYLFRVNVLNQLGEEPEMIGIMLDEDKPTQE